VFRSGRLTRTRLNQIVGWVEKLPHNLKAVAKACNIYPSDLMAWYAAGQDPQCKDPLMVELAWKVAEIRGTKAAQNYARIETLASEGDFKAVEKLEEMSEASAWEISPDAEQAEELHRMMQALAPTPLLGSGEPGQFTGSATAVDGVPEQSAEAGAFGDLGPALGGAVDDGRPGEGGPLLVGDGGDGALHDQTLTPPEAPCKT